MINFNYKNLTPFKCFVLENFPFIEADFDALTEWQLFCKLGKEMNKIINSTNTLGEQTETLTTAFNNLQEYVNQYFSDLNIQNEINNKLNEMAQDGTLAEIINQEIFTDLNNQVIENTQDIAELKKYDFYVDVVAKGINNSGNDVTEALQELINSYDEGTTFYFKNGTYYFKDILLKNNTKILGNTNTKFIIPTNEEIKNIFKIENVSNIEFENLYLQNASNSNAQQIYGGSFDNFKACILLNNANNITIKNCRFNNFFYGLHCIDSNNINVFDSDFSNSGYSMIMAINNCKNYHINNCNFENSYSNISNNTFMIAFTSSGYEYGLTYPENIIIENCNFKNNEYWEGIDTHGANNIKILNCNLFNIKNAIVLFNDERFLQRALKMHDIIIENCYIESELENSRGILVSGSQNGLTNGFLIDNVIIKNNTINIHNITSNNIYALYLHYIKNLFVENNIIKTTRNNLRTHMVIFGTIANNKIESEATQPIIVYYTHLVDFLYNKIYMKGNFPNAMTTFTLSNIYCEGNVANQTDNFNRQYGSSSIFATFGKAIIDWLTMRPTTAIVTSKNVSRNAGTASTPDCTLTGNNGSDIIRTSVNILTVASILQNISIINGEGDGVPLNCYISEYIDEYHFKISTPLLADVVNTSFQLLPRTLA